jgi:hypothetical protein
MCDYLNCCNDGQYTGPYIILKAYRSEPYLLLRCWQRLLVARGCAERSGLILLLMIAIQRLVRGRKSGAGQQLERVVNLLLSTSIASPGTIHTCSSSKVVCVP